MGRVRELGNLEDVLAISRQLDWARPGLDFAHLEEQWWGEPEESEASLLERCRAFRADTDALPDRDRVAVVTHYGFILGTTGLAVPNAAIVPLP